MLGCRIGDDLAGGAKLGIDHLGHAPAFENGKMRRIEIVQRTGRSYTQVSSSMNVKNLSWRDSRYICSWLCWSTAPMARTGRCRPACCPGARGPFAE